MEGRHWAGERREGKRGRRKKKSHSEGKDMADYLLTAMLEQGIISRRFLSFFPIRPEAPKS